METSKVRWKQIGDTGIKIMIAGAGQCLRATAVALYIGAVACQHLGDLAHEKSKRGSKSFI